MVGIRESVDELETRFESKDCGSQNDLCATR